MKFGKKILLIFIALVLVEGLITFTQATHPQILQNSDKIMLKSRQFIPSEENNVSPSSSLAKKHFLIQLRDFPTKEEKRILKEKGVKLLSYIPDKAWFVSFSGVTPQEVMNLSSVRWVGDILPADKISSHILNNEYNPENFDKYGNLYLTIYFHSDTSSNEINKIMKKYKSEIINEIDSISAFTIALNRSLIESIANEDSVQWIEPLYLPIVKELDQSRPRIGADIVQTIPYNLNGSGINVMVYDGAVYSHSDFGDRLNNLTSGVADEHATHVAGIIAGDGTNNSNYKGIAPKAKLFVYNWTTNSPESQYNNTGYIEYHYNEAINRYNTTIESNSWGIGMGGTSPCSWMGDYEAQAQLFDNITRSSLGKYSIIIFSAGNNRNLQKCGDEPYDIWNNFHTINPPKSAKNTIVVGATNSNDDSMTLFSNWGPTDDGRIKPDVVAPGCQVGGDAGIKSTDPYNAYSVPNSPEAGPCGTSYAAPHVAGAVALMLQQYNLTYGNISVLPSTIKALLIHTADDLNNPGPDFKTGWGRVNVNSAVDAIISKNLTENKLSSISETDRYNLSIVGGEQFLKITLVWDDEPATPNAAVTLINDINLVLIAPNGSEYYPWRLNPYDPNATASTGMDNINNVEQVYVSNPQTGKWIVQINASALNLPQNYSLVSSTKLTFYNNTSSSTPNSILCNGDSCNSLFYQNIEINCSGSIDNESDAGTYFIEVNYTNSTNFSVSQFNNSWPVENLFFSGNENITRYLAIPKEANVLSATIRLTGHMPSGFITRTFYPPDDTTVDEEYPNALNGSSDTLNASYMSYSKYVLMKFDLTTLNTTTITNGELVIHINDSATTTFNVRRFNNISWDEDVMTWNKMDQGDLGTLINYTILNTGNNDQTINVGLTSFIQEKINQKTSIWIVPSYPNSITVTSDEGSHRPFFNITYYNLSSPKNPYLEVGIPSGNQEWSYNGLYNISQLTNDFSEEINDYLATCAPIDGICYVPFLFHSDVKSKLQYSDLNVTYQLNKSWQEIGDHTQSSIFNWNISVPPMINQSNVNLRCRARDIDGTNTYSAYYTPTISMSISDYPLTPTPRVNDLKVLYSNLTLRVFEFWINNTGTLGNFSWSFDAGDSTVINSQNITLQTNEAIPVIVEYNYTSSGNFTVIANATSDNASSYSSITVSVGSLFVTEINDIYTNKSEKVFEFKIRNNENTSLSNINWSFNTGENIIYASKLINLSGGEEAFVYFDYNYSSLANRIINVTAFLPSGMSHSKIKYLTYLNLSDFSILNSSYTKRIFGFNIKNLYSSNLTGVYFNMTMGDGSSINSSQAINLIPNEEVFILTEHNYTSSGPYQVNTTARNGTLVISKNITVS